MPYAVAVRDLSVSLDGEPIIKKVSFELAQGEILAVIGPNGSGKTVLLKTLLGMYPHEGSIVWADGVKLGYVPQKIEADRHLPVTLANLLSAKARTLGIPEAEARKTVEMTGISREALHTPVGHLSGGQFQKSLIAFALLGSPNVILFDEPTASLDQLSEAHVYDLIHELQDAYGMAVILVSHDLSVVYRYANKALCLNKEAVCFGTPEEAMKPDVLAKLYGAPHKYFHHLHGNH